jgi:hypothetical protein
MSEVVDTGWLGSEAQTPPAGTKSTVRSSHIDSSGIHHVRYFLNENRDVILCLFSKVGARIQTLEKGRQNAGLHEIHIDTPVRNQGVFIAQFCDNRLRYSVRVALID